MNRVSGLQEDIKTFESIVDEMDVFRKTESFGYWISIIG